MDNLSRNAMLAKQAGMSYGQYKAMQTTASVPVKKDLPEGWKTCKHCGKPFKPKSKRTQYYCEAYCANRAAYARAKEKRICDGR